MVANLKGAPPTPTVLVVDDDPNILDLLALQLQPDGYRILKAHDGLEAIKIAVREVPDIILLDVMMPRMDGFQVCRYLRSYPRLDRIPIIFLTVKSGVGDRQRGLFRGGDAYVAKPFDFHEIRAKLSYLLSHRAVTSGEPVPIDAAAREMSDISAVQKLSEILDENLYKLTLLEEISRAVADAAQAEEIRKVLLVGCMRDIGLGFDRALYLSQVEGTQRFVPLLALGIFPEAGFMAHRWHGFIGQLKDKTLREIFSQGLTDFPFLEPGTRPQLAEMVFSLPDKARDYDLSGATGDEDMLRATELLTAAFGRKFGSGNLAAVPVTAKGQMIGALLVDNSPTGRPVLVEDVKNLLILGTQAGLAIERCRLLEEQNRWTRELERLSNLNLSIIQGAGVGIVYIEPDGTIVTWNRDMVRMTGKEPSRVVGRKFLDIFPALRETFVAQRLERVLAEGVHERVGHFAFKFGRKKLFFDIKMNPVSTRNVIQGTVLIIEDISRRVELENQNREVFQYLSGVIDHSADAIITTNLRGRIRTWNRSARDFFGYTEEQAKGKDLSIIFPRGGKGERAELLRRGAAGEMVQDHEIMLTSATEEKVYASLTVSPIRKADESVSAVGFFIRNITERKKLITQLVQTEKLASLGVMSAGMAHEINNPLTSIIMHTQLVELSPALGSEEREYLAKVAEEVGRISEIVNELLVYSRGREKKLERIDLVDVLKQAVTFVQRKTSTDDIRVLSDIPAELPALMGKANDFLEIFLNILLNAVDAMHGGGTLSVSVTVGHKPGSERPTIDVAIRDTGHGIPASDLSRVFDPFYTTKPPGKGTGLGLMVVNQLVKEYEGSIQVESQVGKGTLFTITIPVPAAS